ncbi:MAG: hypothetical protein GQ570_02690 [Helicobacteraceae bacterium]|nr:hypothetical protein [Helicobacteraceae bacterium]
MSAPSHITNYDLFLELYDCIRNSSNIKEVLKEHGGSNFYIPSYKTTERNNDIIEAYKEGMSIKQLRREYDLSETQIYTITKEVREPSLF